MPDRFIIGLMSGTSVDAIDAALVRISTAQKRYTAKVLHHIEHPWPTALRNRLLAIMAPAQTTTGELCQLNFLVAHHFAAATEKLLQKSHTLRTKITALASHGQTICHLPPKKSKIESGGRQKSKIPSTLQLGDPSVLATLTGITTIANFRPADLALGGQGAPLVPFADAALFTHPTKTRTVQNIGGIANATYLPPSNKKQSILAFDTGPGNMLLDAAISLATHGQHRYDKNGRLAANGSLDMPLFRELQSHPYFTRRPPKSTGREDFGQQLAQQLLNRRQNQTKLDKNRQKQTKIENLLNTITRLTAWSIADAYLHFLPQLPDEVILCGGGADNPTLVQMLAEELAALRSDLIIKHINDLEGGGIPNKSKEAASFALLAAATLDGIPANLPSVTDASRPTILGTISPQPQLSRYKKINICRKAK
ncbi:MAG: anhydro-N-acetylmuramic acid kinase [Phycisphaerales bacterium]|nr:anhydro-N-acetylmuramic acid kinase [Phycisphaerales bacterium]